jgi:alkaline phosphatase D
MGLSFIIVSCVSVILSFGCVPPSREGLPQGSPFIDHVESQQPSLPDGTAIGDISSHSAVLWLKTAGSKQVEVEWASVEGWKRMSAMASVQSAAARTPMFFTSVETDFTLSILLDGLTPGTRYRYYIWVGEADKPGLTKRHVAAQGEFSTLPDRAVSAAVTFAWSGDLGGQSQCRRGPEGYPIFETILKQRPDFFLFLGDTIYGDHLCLSPPNEPGANFVATTLSEYRARHHYQRGASALRRFLETVPVYVMWDDHEVKNNFSGPFEPQMPAGRQALRDYWPIQAHATDPQRLYRSVRYGTDLELFLLDTRQYRSRNADPDSPAKTMLGASQLGWLVDGLSASTAAWKVIATSVPLSVPREVD